jgi:hypothetical protein
MGDTVIIRVIDVIGSPMAVSSRDAQKVHDAILNEFRAGNKVALSFDGTRKAISAFLNVAVGQLYSSLPEGKVDDDLSFEDVPETLQVRIDEVKYHAKRRLQEPEVYQRVSEEVLGTDE